MLHFAKIILLICFCISANIYGQTVHPIPEYVPNELFVKVVSKQNLPFQNGQQAFPLFKDHRELGRIYRLKWEDEEQMLVALHRFQNLADVIYAERIPLYRTSFTPNDLQTSQWSLEKIAAQTAWDIHIGANNATVAVVDDGVLTTHEDLAANITAGFDVADNDANPSPPNGASGNCFSHGTHCAGIVSAVTDNNKGIASLGGHVRIMPVKTKPNSDLGNNCNSLSQTIAGIEYAIAHNADVISMSFGGYASSNAIQELFDQAYTQGIVCVAAAGNDNTSNPSFPASYEHVISVGASNESDQKASFSNFGATLDVMAPGTNIFSTIATNNAAYGTKQGTSMACPLVASLCALMLSYQPNLTPDDLETCLKTSCDNINALNPSFVGQLGAGRINAQQALACLQPEPIAQFTHTPTIPCVGQTVQFTDITTGTPAISRTWSFEGGVPATSTLPNPTVTFATAGAHSVTLSVTNSGGTNTVTQSVNVQNTAATLSGTTTIQEGNSAVLVISLSGTPPFSVTYTDGVTPVTIPTINTTTHQLTVSPTTTTTYSLLSANGIGTCSGTVSGSATVTVIPTGGTIDPNVVINPVGLVCKNTPPFALTAVPVGGVFTGNGITDPLNGLFNPALAGIGTHAIVYIYTAIDGNAYSGTLNITVNGENIHAGNNRFICPGEAIQLTATGGSSYTWLPLFNIEQENTATPIVYPTLTTTYTVTSTDSNGCQSSDAVTIALNPAPYFPEVNKDTTICGQSSVTLPFTDTPPIANYNYTWFPTTGVAESDLPNTLITVTESSFYSLIITNENGCQTVRNFTVLLGNPDVQIDPAESALCENNGITLTASGNDVVQYSWSSGNEGNSLTTIVAGTYSVTATDSQGCTATAAAVVNEGTVLVPQMIGTVLAPNATTTTLSTSETYSSYIWSNNSTSPQITVGEGTYSVTVTDANACSGSATATVRPYDKYATALPTAFSPNNDGTNDEWQIVVPSEAQVSYIIYNRWGQTVFDTAQENVPIWNGKQRGIPCEQGVYVVVGTVVFDDGSSKAVNGTITLLK